MRTEASWNRPGHADPVHLIATLDPQGNRADSGAAGCLAGPSASVPAASRFDSWIER